MNNNNNENNTLEISSDNKNKQTLIVSTIILTFLFMIISIYNLFNKKINIEVNGNISEVSTFTNTIAKAIKEKNINLDKDDFINKCEDDCEHSFNYSLKKVCVPNRRGFYRIHEKDSTYKDIKCLDLGKEITND